MSTSPISIPDNSLKISKISNLYTCLNSKQDNTALLAGGGINIAHLPTKTWPLTNLSEVLLYDNTDNNIIKEKFRETLRLSTRLNVPNICVENKISTNKLVANKIKLGSIDKGNDDQWRGAIAPGAHEVRRSYRYRGVG